MIRTIRNLFTKRVNIPSVSSIDINTKPAGGIPHSDPTITFKTDIQLLCEKHNASWDRVPLSDGVVVRVHFDNGDTISGYGVNTKAAISNVIERINRFIGI